MVNNLEIIVKDPNNENGKSEEYLKEKISHAGYFARQFLKLEHTLFQDRKGVEHNKDSKVKSIYYNLVHKLNMKSKTKKVFDFIYQYYFIGNLTGYDQELYCKIHNNETTPAKITLVNASLFGTLGIAEDLIKAYGAFSMNGLYHHLNVPGKILGGAVLAYGAVATVRNVQRIYQSAWGDKKGREPYSIVPLIMNMPTYVNRVKNRGNSLQKSVSSIVGAIKGNDTHF